MLTSSRESSRYFSVSRDFVSVCSGEGAVGRKVT